MIFKYLIIVLLSYSLSEGVPQSADTTKIKINSDELDGVENIKIKVNPNGEKDCEIKLNDRREIPQPPKVRLLHSRQEHGKEDVKHTKLDTKDCGTEEKILAPKTSEKVETFTQTYTVTEVKHRTLTRRRKFIQRRKQIKQKFNNPVLIIKRKLIKERQTFERIIPRIIETRIVVNHPSEKVRLVTGPVEEITEATEPYNVWATTEGTRIVINSGGQGVPGVADWVAGSEDTQRIVVKQNEGAQDWGGETQKIKINTGGDSNWNGETQKIKINTGGDQSWSGEQVGEQGLAGDTRIKINTGGDEGWSGETQKIKINTGGDQSWNEGLQGGLSGETQKIRINTGGDQSWNEGLQGGLTGETQKIKINTGGDQNWNEGLQGGLSGETKIKINSGSEFESSSGETQRIVVNTGDQSNFDGVVPPGSAQASSGQPFGVGISGDSGEISVKTRSTGDDASSNARAEEAVKFRSLNHGHDLPKSDSGQPQNGYFQPLYVYAYNPYAYAYGGK